MLQSNSQTWRDLRRNDLNLDSSIGVNTLGLLIEKRGPVQFTCASQVGRTRCTFPNVPDKPDAQEASAHSSRAKWQKRGSSTDG